MERMEWKSNEDEIQPQKAGNHQVNSQRQKKRNQKMGTTIEVIGFVLIQMGIFR